MKGDDNSAWMAWKNACDRCVHGTRKNECDRLGAVQYQGSDKLHYFGKVWGGCIEWNPN